MRKVLPGVVIGLVFGLACSKPADPAKRDFGAEFDAYVAERSTCTEDTECALVVPGCPLGCGAAVRPDLVGDVEQKARELITEHDRLEGACKYKCVALRAACQKGRCAAALE